MSDFVAISVAEGVQTIRMKRPDKKNAIDRPMYRAMADALVRANSDPDIAATLIAGTPGAFSAGNDIKDFIAFALGGQPTGEVEAFLMALATAEKPLVAAVDGLAIGIGTTMLLHCDLVFASPASVFRTPFLDLGLVPEAGSSLIAPRLMGHQRAFALLVAGATFDAEEARDANLVYKIVGEGEGGVEAAAMDAALALARKPREALKIGRDLIRGPRETLIERIEIELRHFGERLSSKEARTAFEAFVTKR